MPDRLVSLLHGAAHHGRLAVRAPHPHHNTNLKLTKFFQSKNRKKTELWIRIHHFKWIRIRIRIQGWWTKLKKKNTDENFFTFFLIKIAIYLCPSYYRRGLSALKRGHPTFKKIKFINFFSMFVGHFLPSYRNPNLDTDPGTPLNQDPTRIRIHNIGKKGI